MEGPGKMEEAGNPNMIEDLVLTNLFTIDSTPFSCILDPYTWIGLMAYFVYN